jgi:electron transport complex protein RnfB
MAPKRVKVMANDIYEKLREHLDSIGIGFPKSTTRADLKFLKKLFDEKEAHIYINLTEKLEIPETIAERAGEDPKEVAEILEGMNKKGLVFPGKKGDLCYYAAAPFAHGILEQQVEHMDLECARIVREYITTREFAPPRGPFFLKPIPVNETVGLENRVTLHDDIKALVHRQDRIAVAKCFCRTYTKMLGEGCEKPIETCLMFDFYADYYVENGWARWLSHEEALQLLDQCRDAGLVCQSVNSKNPGAICNCCPDCCFPFQALKKFPKPAEVVTSNYYANADPELCTACETCFDRCPIEAVSLNSEGVAEVNRDRCIGCGLCTVVCPVDALNMITKSDKEIQEPPEKNPFMKAPHLFEEEMN